MQLINRSPNTITWWGYLPNDTSNLVHYRDDVGTLDPGGTVTHDMGTVAVKLEIGEGASSSGGQIYGPFQNGNTIIINTQRQPVEVKGDLARWLSLFPADAPKPAQYAVGYLSGQAAAKMIFDAAINLLVVFVPLGGVEKVGAGLLSALVGNLFGTGTAPVQPPPTLDQIQGAVLTVINEVQAQRVTASILAMRRWYDEQALIGAQLRAAGQTFTADELEDFQDHMDQMLAPGSDLLTYLEQFRSTYSLRFDAGLAYGLALALYSQLRILTLVERASQRALVDADFSTLADALQQHVDVLTSFQRPFAAGVDKAIMDHNLNGTPEGLTLARNVYRRYTGDADLPPAPFVAALIVEVKKVLTELDQARRRAIGPHEPTPAASNATR